MRPTLTASTLFSTRGRVDVLRILWRFRVPMTAAHIARLAGLTHPAASAVLDTLTDAGVADSAPAGRGHTYWLVSENVYVQSFVDPIFAAEESLPDLLEAELQALFAERTLSVVLFGSYARGDQTSDSDVDVVAVAHDAQSKAQIDHDLPPAASAFRRRWGASLSVLTYDPAEASAMEVRAPEFYKSLLEDGIRVSGLLVAEWGSLGTE